jgi:hypothetical protein
MAAAPAVEDKDIETLALSVGPMAVVKCVYGVGRFV